LPALTPKSAIEGEMGDIPHGLQARLISRGAAETHGDHRQVNTPQSSLINHDFDMRSD